MLTEDVRKWQKYMIIGTPIVADAPTNTTSVLKDDRQSLTINVKPGRVALVLGSVVVVLIALSLAATLSTNKYVESLKIREFLSVDGEANLPTAISGGLLLLASILLFVISFVKYANSDRFAQRWAALGAVFAFMVLDELAKIHEHFNTVGILLRRLGWSGAYNGYFHWPWVLTGIVVVVLLALYFRRFIRSLAPRTSILFVASAIIFFGGAIGLEMVGARLLELEIASGATSYLRLIEFHVEEALEMFGVVLFIYAVLDYAKPIAVSTERESGRILLDINC